MNASGRPNTCKSNGAAMHSGRRVRNTYTTYPSQEDNLEKFGLILRTILEWHHFKMKATVVKDGYASD